MSLVRDEAVRCSACRRSYVVEYAIDTGRAARPVETECPHCGAKVTVLLAGAANAFQTRKTSAPTA